MKTCEYELYVPTVDNSGKAFPAGLADSFKKRLIEKFGGLTDTRHRNEGVWRVDDHTMRDEIVIWRLITSKEAEPFLSNLRIEMEKAFKQEKILILARDVRVL